MRFITHGEAASLENVCRVYLYQAPEELACPEAVKAEKALSPKPGRLALFRAEKDGVLQTLMLARLPDEIDYDAAEETVANVIDALKREKISSACVSLPKSLKALSFGVYKQLALANYAFDTYRTTGLAPHDGKEEPYAPSPIDFSVMTDGAYDENEERAAFERAMLVADGILLARRLVNEPANVMTPERLADEARKQGEEAGFTVDVYDEKQIQLMGLHAYYSVAKGSDTPPRFIVMRYMNAPKDNRLLALVGKGLTYDSGGYAIKPAQGMDTMYSDMGGSAAVIGAIRTLAVAKAKVNVVAVVAACENMVSGHAYRNGDIIPSLSGKYIEIVNTDAEGRLTLADGITYAAKNLDATWVIDIATLTGAVGVALGDYITAVLTDSDELLSAISDASEKSGDKVWRLPHNKQLERLNKSDRADIKNSGGRKGGTISAALFCRAFAGGKPWAHLDIAATAFHEFVCPKAPYGGTGVGVELLFDAAETLFK